VAAIRGSILRREAEKKESAGTIISASFIFDPQDVTCQRTFHCATFHCRPVINYARGADGYACQPAGRNYARGQSGRSGNPQCL
jgi:hypothetical protein